MNYFIAAAFCFTALSVAAADVIGIILGKDGGECPPQRCRNRCPWGRVLDGNNCPTCSCKVTCSMEADEVNARLEEANASGRPILGATVPQCDRHEYRPKQCSPSSAWCSCVDRDGNKLEEFGVRAWEADDMMCNCARDKADYEKKGIIGLVFMCDNKGNYEKVQCTGSMCYCADENGNEIPEFDKEPIWNKDDLKC